MWYKQDHNADFPQFYALHSIYWNGKIFFFKQILMKIYQKQGMHYKISFSKSVLYIFGILKNIWFQEIELVLFAFFIVLSITLSKLIMVYA